MSQNIQFDKLSSSLKVERGINSAESRKAKETVKNLEEKIKSLKLELHYQHRELKESKLELSYASHQLYAVYELCEVISLKLITIDEAKELADRLLQMRNLTLETKPDFGRVRASNDGAA